MKYGGAINKVAIYCDWIRTPQDLRPASCGWCGCFLTDAGCFNDGVVSIQQFGLLLERSIEFVGYLHSTFIDRFISLEQTMFILLRVLGFGFWVLGWSCRVLINFLGWVHLGFGYIYGFRWFFGFLVSGFFDLGFRFLLLLHRPVEFAPVPTSGRIRQIIESIPAVNRAD